MHMCNVSLRVYVCVYTSMFVCVFNYPFLPKYLYSTGREFYPRGAPSLELSPFYNFVNFSILHGSITSLAPSIHSSGTAKLLSYISSNKSPAQYDIKASACSVFTSCVSSEGICNAASFKL